MREYVLDQGSQLAVLDDGQVDLGMKGGLHFGQEVTYPLLLVENHRTRLLEISCILPYARLACEYCYKIVNDLFLP